MTNLFALCRKNGNLQVKRVIITQDVQNKISGVFAGQEIAFLDDISEEIQFGSDWKPDSDEILVMDEPAEAAAVTAAMTGDLLALETINSANFMGEGIKALAVAAGTQDSPRILIQVFTAQQILARRFTLMFSGDGFRELTEPAFTLDNYLVGIIENNKLKFKSFFSIKRVFELTQIYQEATDQQIDAFCAHDNLRVASIAAFKTVADQNIRKLVHAIHQSKIIEQYKVEDIVSKAKYLGMEIIVENGKIVLPSDKKDIKQLLRFLDDGIYEAPLTAKRYVTNSKRPFS